MPEREQGIGKASEALRYPKDLVDSFGAKAGILMYIARELPDIPQAPMIVSEIGEPARELLRRADEAGIRRPRIFRSSAIVELAGYEGDFRTLETDNVDQEEAVVEFVRRSTESFKDEDPSLPVEINVIVAERSPSRFVGTYIKLPNQDDQYLISALDLRTKDDSFRDMYDYLYAPTTGPREFGGYSTIFRLDEKSDEIEQVLPTIVSWHDRIAQLPLMDQRWVYQIEFGLDPLCLYQVRPFLPIGKAGFKVEKPETFGGVPPVVIGVAGPEFSPLRVVTYPENGHKDLEDINPGNEPLLFHAGLQVAQFAEYLPNLKALFLSNRHGFLSHGGIKQMRKAPVTVIIPTGFREATFTDGALVGLASDGVNIQIERA